MKNRKLVRALPVLLFISLAGSAQVPPPIAGLENKLNLYGIKNQSPILFIHFDKNVYTNNEQVWLTGYLFGADIKAYKTLSLALVKDDSHAILMDDRFVIRNGLAFGNTFVPDTVGPGNYTFIATTNRLVNGKPDVLFIQPVTIKTDRQPSYTASLNPVDTSATAPQQKVLLLVSFGNIKEPPPSVPVWYYIGNAAHPVFKDSVKTKAGQYAFNIPSKPLAQGKNILHVQLNYKNETKQLSMALPVLPQPVIVNFYPEGGNLVNSIQSTVGWEVKSAAGPPLAANAVLYEGEKVVDTLSANSYGMGRFTLTPKAGSNYTVKLHGVNRKDTAYKLPTALTARPALALGNAIVNDTLTVNIRDGQQETLYLIGHNFKQVFFTTPINMTTPNKRVKLIINDIPKGLTHLTLTDSLGRPFAERIFFAHYDRREPLIIGADKNEYATREKVTVKVKLDSNVPDSGFVSVACVQENRLEIKKKEDIESYFYLKNDLGQLPARDSYLSNSESDRQFLENVLLIKGWSRYTWADMLKAIPADTVRKYDNITFKGNVTQNFIVKVQPWEKNNFKIRANKPLKKAITLSNLNSPLHSVTTDNTGFFTVDADNMVTLPNKNVALKLNMDNPENYEIEMPGPFAGFNKILAGQLLPENYAVSKQHENTHDLQLNDNEHAIHLNEVKINGSTDDSFYGTAGHKTSNACGDYVCSSNILNCPEHRSGSIGNYPPVAGHKYYIPGSGGFTYYVGCGLEGDLSIHLFKGIYAAQEFYPVDYSKTAPTQPEYLSTIYWKHLVKISSAKETEFSFYTGDITGRFKIVVQGVTANDVTYGEKTFNVVKGK